MEAIHLNEFLKVLGIGLTPASFGIVGYFLYRALIGEHLALKKEVTELQDALDTAYVRRDINEEKTRRLEGEISDLQRQIDILQRWRDRFNGND